MPDIPARTALRQQLKQLEHELRQLELWSNHPPDPAALASQEPFCIDTLSLAEWLQWLMIPRLHALLDGQHPLPSNCHILAIAEESFKALGQRNQPLLQVIEQLDQLITTTA